MAKTKQQKKYNPERAVRIATQNLCFEHREIWGKEIICEYDSGVISKLFSGTPSESECRAAANVIRRWYLEVVAWCLDSNGQQYQKSQPIETEACRIDNLRDHYIAHSEKMEINANAKHLITLGFRARPLTPQLQQQLTNPKYSPFQVFG